MPEQTQDSPLALDVECSDDCAVVRLSGRLGMGVNDMLYARVSRLIPNHKRIVLDLTDLKSMDSLGLGTLVRLYVSAKAGGSAIELVNLRPRIRELFAITNLLSVFSVIGEHHGTSFRC